MKKILTLAAAMFAALTSAFADDLAIAPSTISNAMQQVYFEQSFTATGGSGSYSYDGWKVMPWTCAEEASSYAVGANETPLWDGAQSFNTNYCFLAYELPFSFPWRGGSYDQVRITTRGIIFLGEERGGQSYFYDWDPYGSYLGKDYPVLAPLWTYSYNVKARTIKTSPCAGTSFCAGSGRWA